MDMHPSFIQEFCQIYSEISSRRAVVRSISTLRELGERRALLGGRYDHWC
ncbi:hypothetical protein CASFOL_013575 [Castilleja foliolosa]|uniref:Uncharacterized protein n=1 Tax=Castilleja foliolosa TaxID=1961234 RepID=A0ABD3DPG1_9LAMI